MTEKRFTVHIRWYDYEKTEGEIELFDNGQPLLLSESVEDVQWIKSLLNELHEENVQLKSVNFNLNKTVECLHETVKKQCKQLDWADECGVQWNEEYNEWIGGKEWLKE